MNGEVSAVPPFLLINRVKCSKKEEYPPEGTPMRKPTVLIVDDDEDMRFVLKNLLNYWGYQAITACGAKGTLEILKKEDATCGPLRH